MPHTFYLTQLILEGGLFKIHAYLKLRISFDIENN